ncbi:WPP domain-associated protein-like [Eutrema salsugineum]|uniref:WPP domain-associated protein-like n=1 Tax=Eutrema salsugineum TaxID=72664 RepID=UPI000CED4DE9|nr:WPP domain-associated protein-like [Eutrema salsugineum]
MGEEVMIGDNGTLDSHDHVMENENPIFVDFLEDEMNNRLTVSRSVSDSVTRDMGNEVETEADEKIAQTELEHSRLKEILLLHRVGSEKNETSQSCLILDECEQRLSEQDVESCSCGKKSLVLEKTKEIAGLRRELELISKLLSGHANKDVEALEDQKRSDLLHRKISGSLGKHIGSVTSKLESIEYLRQLSREQLINHFKSEMNQLRREHDYAMQEMTEEYFSIKRRYLKLEECGSFSSLKKDKEFDLLRKKIPDIISKLDKVLLEDENSVIYRETLVEKERLKEENHLLECLVKEKENLVQIAQNDLATERAKLELAFHQINKLQFQIDQQAVVIQDRNKELEVVSARSLEETEGYEMEITELKQKLELARKNMKITEHEKMESELKLSTTQAEQKRLQNQIVSTCLSLANWSQGFDNLECLVAEKMKKTNSRLRSMQSQLNDLSDEVDELKVRESMYKQQMEKKTCDLQKAETEVDLLGDEIDSLLDLFEKIYIALDHYSPILKHYPGVIEILKLVRRELRRDSKR